MKKIKIKPFGVIVCIVVLVIVSISIARMKNDTSNQVAEVSQKPVSMPYINPEWTEYMKLSDEEKQAYGSEPSMYIYDYIPSDVEYGELPSSYNLRETHPTTLYDQGNEGLCWAYATVEMIESNLKTTRNIDEQFSIDQLDMLTMSANAYEGKYNPYSFDRPRGDGLKYGDELRLNNEILTSGMFPVKKSKFDVDKYSEDIDYFNINDVANSDNVDYTITETVEFPRYVVADYYQKMIKKFIMENGAIRLMTSADFNEKIIDRPGSLNGHAMIIVGWDDNLRT